MKKSYRRILSVGLFVVLIGGLVFALTGCGFLNQAPVAIITTDPAPTDGTGPVEVSVDEPIDFNGSDSHDMEGVIASYDWDFDKNSSVSNDSTTGETVQSVSYSVADTYTVTLTVTDEGTSPKTGTDTVEVDVS